MSSIPTRSKSSTRSKVSMSVALYCIFSTEPNAWHRRAVLKTSVPCMNKYCQLCWERWEMHEAEKISQSKPNVSESQNETQVTRMFCNTDRRGVLLQKQFLLRTFVNIECWGIRMWKWFSSVTRIMPIFTRAASKSRFHPLPSHMTHERTEYVIGNSFDIGLIIWIKVSSTAVKTLCSIPWNKQSIHNKLHFKLTSLFVTF